VSGKRYDEFAGGRNMRPVDDPCGKHGVQMGDNVMPIPAPCPHCAADSEILEEKIEAVVRSVVSVVESRAAGPRLDEFRIALLELVR
jgi:hypothetical protein